MRVTLERLYFATILLSGCGMVTPAGDGNNCQDVDECADPSLNTCDPLAACIDKACAYKCECPGGYAGDGHRCEDVDECADPALNDCDPAAACTNTPGSYGCACPAGYRGDGMMCEDVDECADPALNTCGPMAACANTPGSYTCECLPGYAGDGWSCADVDECARPALNTCDAQAVCTNTSGSYECVCATGYSGDGRTCEDIDECSDPALNTCDALAVCTNTPGSHACACPGGDIVGDGHTCAFVDAPCNVSYAVQFSVPWELYVPEDCTTIQRALDAVARTGNPTSGTILVEPGRYTENLDFLGVAVTLRSTGGPEQTVIDGSAGGTSVVRFASRETSRTVLDGFTITGGTGTQDSNGRRGGGIYVDGASPTLRNLIVEGNAAEGMYGYGGGISIYASSAKLERSVVRGNNSSYYGGGLYLGSSPSAAVYNTVIADNSAVYGGGIALYYSSSRFENLLILDNFGNIGAGIMVQGSGPRIVQSTLHGNDGDTIRVISGALPTIGNTTISGSRGFGIRVEEGGVTAFYSNLWDNASGPTSGVSPPSPALGNLTVDPLFTSLASFDWSGWDLTLQGTSPLIGAGDPTVSNPDGTRSDIGAYGGPRAEGW